MNNLNKIHDCLLLLTFVADFLWRIISYLKKQNNIWIKKYVFQ